MDDARDRGTAGRAGPVARAGRALKKPETLIFSFYALVTAVMTYPAVTLVSRTYAEKRDPYILIWWTWWMKYAFINRLPLSPINLAAAPFEYRWSPYALDSLTHNVLRALSIAFNETVAYNVFLLLCFFFTCVAAYLLVRYLTGSRPAAAFCGLAFGFSPYMLMHGKEHINLMAVFAIPWLALLLVKAWEKRTFGSMLACGVVFVAATAFSYQNGLLGAVYAASFLFFICVAGVPWRRRKDPRHERDPRKAARFALSIAPVLLLVAVALAVMYGALAKSPQSGSRELAALQRYSARPWDYVVPGPDGAVLGWLTRDFVYSHLHGGFPVESTLFLGFTTLALAACALVGRWRGRKRRVRDPAEPSEPVGTTAREPGHERRPLAAQPGRVMWAMAGTAVVAFVFSMPPTATVLGVKLYFPGYFLHKVLPSFRAYARFGLIVMLCATVLAGYGIAWLIGSRSRRTGWLVAVVLSALVLAEFTVAPPLRSLDTSATEDYFKWLAGRPGQFTVAVYPWYAGGDFTTYGYLFAQRHHEKRLANGAQPGTEGELFRQVLLDAWDPGTPGLLARLGVKYVVIIPSLYDSRDVRHGNYVYPRRVDDDLLARLPEGYRLARRFGDAAVYEVTAEPADFFALFNEGAIDGFLDPGGTLWHPVAGTVMVDVNNRTGAPVTADLSFTARPTSPDTNLEMFLNDKRTGARMLQPGPNEVALGGVTLKPGVNRLLLSGDGPLVPAAGVPGYENTGASMLVTNVSVTPRR